MSATSCNPVEQDAPQVRVIVVAYGSSATLQACVDSLLSQTMSDFEAVIVDNGPAGDEAVSALTGLDERFVTLSPDANLGFAGGNNLGAEGACTKWLALLNPDAMAEPEWLETLIRSAEEAGAEMAGSMQLWDGHDELLDGSGDAYHVSGIAWRGLRGKPRKQAPPSGETFAPCAAAALYDTKLFQRVGGFDERFFAYHEDVDLAFRMRLAGARTLQVQEARVRHVASGEPGRASALAVRLGTRNRIWTYLKNMPGALVWLLAPLHFAAIMVSLARDARRGRGGAAARGIWEAFADIAAVLGDRASVQRQRSASISGVMRAMTVSPMALMRTRADVRPWRADRLLSDE